MKNILLFLPAPFLKRDYYRFGIDILKKNFTVNIIDVTAWINKDFWNAYSKETYKNKELVVISCKEDFLKFVSNIDTAIVLDFMPYNGRTHWIRKILKNKNCIFVNRSLNKAPRPKKNFFKFLFKLIFEPFRSIHKWYKILLHEYYKRQYIPDIFLFGGLASSSDSKAKNKIGVHSMDYDIYLNIKNKPKNNTDSYAVFLDEDMIYHPEHHQLNYEPPATEAKYYPTLIQFLKKFEIENGLKVKFALSPKSYNKNLPNLLKDIDYSIGNTAELVKNSKAVLLHCSTAMSYGILFKKPIIFLTTDELLKSWIGPRIEVLASILKSRPINMSNNLNNNLKINNLLRIDEKVYKNYLDLYLKVPNTPEIPLWQIFIEYLRSEKYV